jgi:uncharacterized repeat protein (TIGR01451 family)
MYSVFMVSIVGLLASLAGPAGMVQPVPTAARAYPAGCQPDFSAAPAAPISFSRAATDGLRPAAVAFDALTGDLTITGNQHDNLVTYTMMSDQAVLIQIDGHAYSSDPQSPFFAPALAGATCATVSRLHLAASAGSDTLLLDGSVQANQLQVASAERLVVAGEVRASGSLHLRGATVLVRGHLTAPDLAITSDDLLNIATGATLRARTGRQGGSLHLSGRVVMTGGDLVADGASGGAVQVQAHNMLHHGSISASSLDGAGGQVQIAVANSYIDTASAHIRVDSAAAASGGRLTIHGGPAGRLYSSGQHSAIGMGMQASGGSIALTGHELLLVGAQLNASGGAQGGQVWLGGGPPADRHAVAAATHTTITPHTTVRADAQRAGDGGSVIVWAAETTTFAGQLAARGGALSGSGGMIDVSAGEHVAYQGQADTSAPAGHSGTLLLDPRNITIDAASGQFPQFDLINPTPDPNDTFGNTVTVLSNGNIVVVDPGDDFVATDAGAAYLFDGQTGALLSTLTGSSADDLTFPRVIELPNGNYVLRLVGWDNGAITNAGAITWADGTTGVSGVIDATNSLVGTSIDDLIGNEGVLVLENGNYLVRSSTWDNGPATNAGAVTWGDGTTGVVGEIDATNSLVGSSTDDEVGDRVGSSDDGVIELTNGNYLVVTPFWDNTASGDTNAGAVTWGDGTSGVVGEISAANSLVGSSTDDQIGSWTSGGGSLVGSVFALANGNYVVQSVGWDNTAASATDAGAVTWGDGANGTVGAVSVSNSLVGTTTDDEVGRFGQITILTNSNYVVRSPDWDNPTGGTVDVGAATWVNGSTGQTSNGVNTISAANSLIGGTANDSVSSDGVRALTNDNYVVQSPEWDNPVGPVSNVGAATWGDGTTGVVGEIDATNSLVGSSESDQVGDRIFGDVLALPNGSYVVGSALWNNPVGPVIDVGAVTWGTSFGGIAGEIDATNSLIGSTTDDQVGRGLTSLGNGNYVIRSSQWDNGAATDAGAVTWGNGTNGTFGPTEIDGGEIDATNSLVGTTTDDRVGFSVVRVLSNGNYVVPTPNWDNPSGPVADVGAVTLGSGTSGIAGTISAANSLIGITSDDQVGSGSTIELDNGNYVVSSPTWSNGAISDAGAVTWGDGGGGTVGTVTAANSLVGSSFGDRVGDDLFDEIIPLENGNYLVVTPRWDNGAATDAGAVTWGDGTSGVAGEISADNSLVGSTTDDQIGTSSFGSVRVLTLANGNYVVQSSFWDNGAATDAGAVTWGDGTGGTVGAVSIDNSIVGSTTDDQINDVLELSDGNYLVNGYNWDNGALADAGFVSWVDSSTGATLTGDNTITPQNSLIGQTASARLQEPDEDPTHDAFVVAFVEEAGGRVTVAFVDPAQLTYARGQAQDITITPVLLQESLARGTAVTIQASNDITLTSDLTVAASGSGGALALQAGRSLLLDANITTDNGGLSLIANDRSGSGVVDAYREPGAARVQMAAGTRIDTGNGPFVLDLRDGAGNTNTASGSTALETIQAGSIAIASTGDILLNGPLTSGSTLDLDSTGTLTTAADVVLTAGDAVQVEGEVVLAGPATIDAGGAAVSFGGQLDLGASPLIISGTLQLAPTASLQAAANSTTAGRLVVNGSIDLAGTELVLTIDGAPPAEDIILIENDGSDAVTDTFAGLPEGARLVVGSSVFQVSYRGGDGNDVVLSPQQAPVFTSTPVLTATQGVTYTALITTSSSTPGETLTLAELAPLPPWLSLTPTGNGSARLSGVPPAEAVGTANPVRLQVTSSTGLTATQEFSITVLPAARLSIDLRSSAGVVQPGDSLEYTILITNETAVDAQGVVVTIVLPSGLEIAPTARLAATGTGWTCSYNSDSRRDTCTRPLLAPGSAPPLTLATQVTATSGTLAVTAQVTADNSVTGQEPVTATDRVFVGQDGIIRLYLPLLTQF